MTEQAAPNNPVFLALVQQYQFMGLIHLGKMVHPESQKTERNLEAARASIEILGMLEEKTKGNLTSEEDRFLHQVLTNLRLNFVDEADRKEETPTDEKREEGKPKEGKPGEGEAGEGKPGENQQAGEQPAEEQPGDKDS
jgi:hypothetical protein